jgi:hypothetical protein
MMRHGKILPIVPHSPEMPMRKITLSIDALRVESFQTAAGVRQTGTVHAYATVPRMACYSAWDSCTCPIASVCDYSCENC